MGYEGDVETLEEIESSPSVVFSVIADLNLAHAWGQTPFGMIQFPQAQSLKLGHEVDVQPKGMKEPFRMKVRVIRYGQMIDMEVVEGPFFGNLVFQLEERPYGTLLTSTLHMRIERMGFRVKWMTSENKKYKKMMEQILKNIKNFSESRSI